MGWCSALATDLVFGRLQHALETPQQGEREDDPPILRLLEIATQKFGERPDVGRELGSVGGHGSGVRSLGFRAPWLVVRRAREELGRDPRLWPIVRHQSFNDARLRLSRVAEPEGATQILETRTGKRVQKLGQLVHVDTRKLLDERGLGTAIGDLDREQTGKLEQLITREGLEEERRGRSHR